MALRNRLPDQVALYPDPVLGVNLRDAQEDLQAGESPKMQNCIFRGGLTTRLGSQRLTGSALQAGARIRGGHKFYFSTTSKIRLVAYGSTIAKVDDAGVATALVTNNFNDLDTFFLTWPITDKVYIVNGANIIEEYDGTTFRTVDVIVGATNVPGTAGSPAARQMVAFLDRLLCITTNGIERTNARVAHVWSLNSTWATFRPQLAGLFTALAPFSLRSIAGDITTGVLAFQSNAYYIITGTDFGSDVTAVSPSAGEDSRIQLIDSSIGTSSPYSVVSAAGIGTFWVTSDLNVAWIPTGTSSATLIGDKIRSNTTIAGLESANIGALSQIWCQIFDRFLMVGFPTGSNNFATTQFWLDLISLRGEQPVWYGPMTGQSVGRSWIETQSGDNAIYGGEGNPTTGAFIYRLQVPNVYKDAVGLADNNIAYEYQTYFKSFGQAGLQKYLRSVEFDANNFSGSMTVDIKDLTSTVATGLTVVAAP